MANSRGKRQRFGRTIALAAVLAIATTAGAATSASAATPVQPSVPSVGKVARDKDAWREQLPQVPRPPSACATATYPYLEWTEAQCTQAPDITHVPKVPGTPRTPMKVGDGSDISAMAPTGFITMAIGSFDNATNVTSVSSPIGNAGPPVANAYTLQLNTDFFTSTACAGSPNPGCLGWEQFIFANDPIAGAGIGFIQYWLLRYNATCPTGWFQFQFTGIGDIYCYRNSTNAVPIPFQPITNLANLSVAGTATATGDSVTVFVGSTAYSVSGDNSVNAAAGWRIAEFNVFGYGGNQDGGGMATFNSGASLSVRTRILYGGTQPPICVAQGFTGETNNLGFTSSPPVPSQPGPALMFVENTSGSSVPNCATQASTIGDPHLRTFGGTFYDFQATGDFLLAQADPEFVVQARHISSAPRWPNAAYNSAVATQMGPTRVAVCASRDVQLYVNGDLVSVPDSDPIYRDGVSIVRVGSTYTVIDDNGNSIRATIREGTWIDVEVGLGQWPTTVTGLLASHENSPYLLEGGDGEVYQVPLDFEALYGPYGESWRVRPEDSLLNDCGEVAEGGNPERPFFVDDLDRRTRELAVRVCQEAGVSPNTPTILDACTLDVAVLGTSAAHAYVGAEEPPVNGNP